MPTRILPAFFIALCSALLFPAFFPSWKLTFFAPYLILVYYKSSFYRSLWQALIIGLIVDFISSQSFFGLHCLSYVFSSMIIYWQRKVFFAERYSTMTIMTILFAIITTIIQIALHWLFGQNITLSWKWLLTDLVVMPIIDGAYALVGFCLPSYLPGFFKRTSQRKTDENY